MNEYQEKRYKAFQEEQQKAIKAKLAHDADPEVIREKRKVAEKKLARLREKLAALEETRDRLLAEFPEDNTLVEQETGREIFGTRLDIIECETFLTTLPFDDVFGM